MTAPRLVLRTLWPVAYMLALTRAERMPTKDRRILETEIFREVFCDARCCRLLSVGVSRYTAWYPKLFRLRRGFLFETVDADPAAAVWGSFGHHYVARMQDLRSRNYDAILLNGVFNYGTDSTADKDAVIAACGAALVHGGLLLIGYRQREPVPDFDPSDLDSSVFEPVRVPGFATPVVPSGHDNGHAFAAYRRA